MSQPELAQPSLPAWGPPAPVVGDEAVPAAATPPARPRSRRRPLLLAVLAVVVVGGLVAVGVHLAVAGHQAAVAAAHDRAASLPGGLLPAGVPTPGLPPSAVPPPSAVLPPATQQPTGLGTDAELDGEAEHCSTGTMSACVELYLSSYRDPALARYAAYGDTCAGRQPAGTLRLCTASFPR